MVPFFMPHKRVSVRKQIDKSQVLHHPEPSKNNNRGTSRKRAL
jgi:hypothetical protein